MKFSVYFNRRVFVMPGSLAVVMLAHQDKKDSLRAYVGRSFQQYVKSYRDDGRVIMKDSVQ